MWTGVFPIIVIEYKWQNSRLAGGSPGLWKGRKSKRKKIAVLDWQGLQCQYCECRWPMFVADKTSSSWTRTLVMTRRRSRSGTGSRSWHDSPGLTPDCQQGIQEGLSRGSPVQGEGARDVHHDSAWRKCSKLRWPNIPSLWQRRRWDYWLQGNPHGRQVRAASVCCRSSCWPPTWPPAGLRRRSSGGPSRCTIRTPRGR